MVRLNLDEDVKPLSEFRASVASCIRRTRQTRPNRNRRNSPSRRAIQSPTPRPWRTPPGANP